MTGTGSTNAENDGYNYYSYPYYENYTDIITVTTTTIMTANTSISTNHHHNNNTINATISDNDDFFYFPDGDPMAKEMYRLAMWVIKLLFPIIVVVGTFGNTMILVVLKKGAIRTDNLAFFLSVLAVVDTLVLYGSCFRSWLRVVAGVNLLHMGSWSCKLILFLNQTGQCVSAWMMVIITWQRWYTCAMPFQRCCPTESSKWGYLGLSALLFVLVGANSYVLFTAELYKGGSGYMCAPSEEFDELVGEFFPLILFLLYSGVPAVFLFLLNGLLVHVLYRSRRALLSSDSASRVTGRDEVRARYNQVTKMLVVLCALWFVFAMPQTVLKQFELDPQTAQQFATNVFVNVIAYTLLFLNHSINFFVYCALMRSFRREVMRTARQAAACLTSTVHDGISCSSTRQESTTEIHLNGHHHHNHCNNNPHHNHRNNQQNGHHHHHYHHPHPNRCPLHHHQQQHRNGQADGYTPLIIKPNNKPDQAGGFVPQAQSY